MGWSAISDRSRFGADAPSTMIRSVEQQMRPRLAAAAATVCMGPRTVREPFMFARKPQPLYPLSGGRSPERPGGSHPGKSPSMPGEPLASTNHSSDAALGRRAAPGERAAPQLLVLQLQGAVHATLYPVVGS